MLPNGARATLPPSPTRKSESPVSEGSWEVEQVLDYTRDASGHMYLVKWKDWDADFNTWEPPENLRSCEQELLRFFLLRKQQASEQSTQHDQGGKRRKRAPPVQVPPDPRPLLVRAKPFFDRTHQPTEHEKQEAELLWRAERGKKKKERCWAEERLSAALDEALDGRLSRAGEAELRTQILLHDFHSQHADVNAQLQAWEAEINATTGGLPLIRVENDVDLSGPPPGFKYINDCIPRRGVTIPDDPPLGCHCQDCFAERKTCCAEQFSHPFAYTAHRKLRVPIGTPIYECNRKCACGPDCPNRVVQDGRVKDSRLAIFRTPTMGWGVKTLKAIKRGSFVTLYVGEVIVAEEATRRGREYDAEGWTYLFDLDFNEGEAPYTVDAAHFGNIAHFLNHSCDPNLAVFSVWVNCLDPNLPQLALFAIKDIPRGSELTFDYQNQISNGTEQGLKDDGDSGHSPSRPQPRLTPCLCQAANCRQYLFGLPPRPLGRLLPSSQLSSATDS